ncbi:PRA1 family protein-domain-containing protein [Bipolaris maydis]|nr:prenylated rab acceptor 1 [Bipolaris maydis]KAJ6193374.1 PRA1 family protein-domain-containing protein [Bipolaris maydis]KAJ6267959.1 prenylated rab acceptor 1 [Bipolaris maydis]
MSRFSIPIDALTSRMNFGGRFDSLRSTSVSSRFANLRPISEFFDVKRMSKPANFGEVQSRVNYNLGYFSSNYAAVFVMLSIYSLLTNLMLLFVICLVVGGMYGIGKLEGNDLELGSWRATTSQLYTTLFVIAVPLGLWASPFTTVLWLIGATGVTVVGHAAFMDKPIEPPGGSSGVGRYFEGVDDVHRFQELSSDDENGGVTIEGAFEPALDGKKIDPDELYFNDMDIRAWERRTSALAEPMHGPVHGYRGYREEYFGGPGETINPAEVEEMLFRRVLDKIRVARAAGNTDVSLSAEELDAYQSRLYGARAPAVRPEPQPRPSSASSSKDTASVLSYDATGKHDALSRSKKSQQRTSMPGSKSKKEKRPSAHKRTSTASTTESHAMPPGFVVPGPDGQSTYAPINAYEGSLVRGQGPVHPTSRSASDNGRHVAMPLHRAPSINMLGSFPESVYDFQPESPLVPDNQPSYRQTAYEADVPADARTGSSSVQSARLVPFPVEPYQYHNFSPTSSSSPTSPQPQYTRSLSSVVSEASYASVPRRVPPAPPLAPAPVPVRRVADVVVSQDGHNDVVTPGTQPSSSATAVQVQGKTKDSGNGQGGERRRKGGKGSKKKG